MVVASIGFWLSDTGDGRTSGRYEVLSQSVSAEAERRRMLSASVEPTDTARFCRTGLSTVQCRAGEKESLLGLYYVPWLLYATGRRNVQ